MKIALEIDVPDSTTINRTMVDVAERVGRLIGACRAYGAPAPATVRLPPDIYFEASVTCARPSHGPETLLEQLLITVPDLREIKVDRHTERS